MAHSNDNVVMKGMQGIIGDMLVFKTRGGKTIVTKIPQRKEGQITTEKQQKVQDRFSLASLYAKAAITDPDTKAAYLAAAEPGQSANNVAFADFFNAPIIMEVLSKNYNGTIGSTLGIRAKDDFKVTRVQISIHGADGALIEEGDAAAPANTLEWIYTVNAANAIVAGSKINVTVYDVPGNETSMEVTL